MLKVGDKLLCKKNNNNRKYNNYKLCDKLLCKKSSECYKKYEGKCYTISKIDIKNEYYTITDIQKFYVYVCYDWYKLSQNDKWYIWDYFYKPQEVRKLKLKQLKQCLK